MLDKLIEFLLEIIEKIIPIYILKQYQLGVLFRFGHFKQVSEPGLHWKIPFFDDVESYPVVTTTLTLPAQSVVTKDGISVVVKAVIKYKISDVKIFAVEVYDAIDALSDTTCGIIYQTINNKNFADTVSQNLNRDITREAKKEAKKWGIDIEKVTITDYSKMNSLRLFNEQSKLID